MNIEEHDWPRWVRWCNDGLPDAAIDSLIMSLVHLAEQSTWENPIFACHLEHKDYTAAGYLILYPGSLGSLGSFRFLPHGDDTKEAECLSKIVATLCEEALLRGVELVQAISPLEPEQIEASYTAQEDDDSNASKQHSRERVLTDAGMISVAKLVQIELAINQNSSLAHNLPDEASTPKLPFVPHDQIPQDRWHTLVQDTYLGTLDVPELNGLRSISNTLEGYAWAEDGSPKVWWVILQDNQAIGCLLLSPMSMGCELTYLGLLPQYRGKGLAKKALEYAIQWCESQGLLLLSLAVDVRNKPAIQLYRAFGFQPVRFVQAWIYAQR